MDKQYSIKARLPAFLVVNPMVGSPVIYYIFRPDNKDYTSYSNTAQSSSELTMKLHVFTEIPHPIYGGSYLRHGAMVKFNVASQRGWTFEALQMRHSGLI